MSLLYRLLGIVARLNEKMSRFRVNFIPFNLLVIFLLVLVVGTFASETRDSFVNGATPHPISVAEAVSHRDTTHNYVAVSGLLVQEPLISTTRKSKYGDRETVEYVYYPLVDKEKKLILLVRGKGETSGTQEDPRPTVVTGMLLPLPKDIQRELQQNTLDLEGVKLDTDYMLVSGNHPGGVGPSLIGLILSGLTLGALLLTLALKYVIFQPGAKITLTNLPAVPATALSGLDLGVTGSFQLQNGPQRRFLNVPSGFSFTNDGLLALHANIDASSHMYGIKTQDLSGTWFILLPPAELKNMEYGTLYDGFSVRPALRVPATTRHRGASATILSFDRSEARDALVTLLNRPSSSPLDTPVTEATESGQTQGEQG